MHGEIDFGNRGSEISENAPIKETVEPTTKDRDKLEVVDRPKNV